MMPFDPIFCLGVGPESSTGLTDEGPEEKALGALKQNQRQPCRFASPKPNKSGPAPSEEPLFWQARVFRGRTWQREAYGCILFAEKKRRFTDPRSTWVCLFFSVLALAPHFFLWGP